MLSRSLLSVLAALLAGAMYVPAALGVSLFFALGLDACVASIYIGVPLVGAACGVLVYRKAR